ncbi:MAG: hypothetical protein QOI20_2938 [Acidimicrobiaceae bacterium]|nr:hypothetical protein [Acidimicrobiaceae bacterium]
MVMTYTFGAVVIVAEPAAAHGGTAGRLIDLADVAVYGTVNSSPRTEPSRSGAAVDTVYSVSVDRLAKGLNGLLAVDVRVPGGDLGDGTAVYYSNAAHLDPGERVLLFLRERGSDGAYSVVGGTEGAIHAVVSNERGFNQRNARYDADVSSLAVGDSCAGSPSAGFSGFSMWMGGGHHLVQPGSALSFAVNAGFNANTSAVDSALSRWNSAGGTFRIADGGATAASANTTGDALNTIGWGTVTDGASLAEAVPRVSTTTGAIAELDIVFNQAKPFSMGTASPTASQYDVVAVMLHEMGHALGFDHQTDTNSVMATCVLVMGDNTRRTLSGGDAAGHRNFYPPDDDGYNMVGESGAVYGLGGLGSFGHYNANYYGGANAGNVVNYPTHKVTDLEIARPTRAGYLILGSNGGVYAYGDAGFRGSAAGLVTGTAVDMTVHPTGSSYWIVASDGGVFAFPNPGAPFYGSAAGVINGPAIGIAASVDGGGYWIVSDKGSVYAYGNAPFKGGGIPSSAWPAKSITPSLSGQGYWILGNDGLAYRFGDASVAYLGYNTPPRKISREPLSNGVVSIASPGWTALVDITDYGWGTGDTFAAVAATRRPSPPSLTHTASPSTLTVPRGQTRASTLTVQSNDTFWSTVSFSVSGAPAGVAVSISPPSLMLPSSSIRTSTLSVTPSQTYTTPTTFTLTVSACGQGICRTTPVNVVVSLA